LRIVNLSGIKNVTETEGNKTVEKVWIEAPKFANMAESESWCKAANAMLRKLGVTYDAFWACDEQRYCATLLNVNLGPGGSGYQECSDRGHWFNLDYLSK
jgi:hypothetical protein